MTMQSYPEPTQNDVDLLVQVFDATLIACDEHDYDELLRCLHLLRAFIDFEHSSPTMAWGVYQIYRHCEALALEDDFDGAAQILEYLQRLWIEA